MMNSTHFHLLVNHLPIVGVLLGIIILLIGMLLNKTDVKLTALGVFVFSAITSVSAFYTGDGAEEEVEHIAGISETLIHTHEEYAELFFVITLILGALSLLGLLAELKHFMYSKYLMILILLLALADGVVASFVGTSGGEIRHTEIRNEARVIQLEKDDD